MKILPDFKIRNQKSTCRIKLFCYYFSFLLLVSIQVARAQNTNQIKISGNEEWKSLKDTANISFSYKVALCNDKPVALLRIKNSNLNSVRVKWSLWWSEMDAVIFNSGEEKTGSCDAVSYLIYQIPVGSEMGLIAPPLVVLSIN